MSLLRVCAMFQVGSDWQQVIDKISRGRILPLLLVYADHDDVPSAQCQESSTKISIRDLELSTRPHTELITNGRGIIITLLLLAIWRRSQLISLATMSWDLQ